VGGLATTTAKRTKGEESVWDGGGEEEERGETEDWGRNRVVHKRRFFPNSAEVPFLDARNPQHSEEGKVGGTKGEIQRSLNSSTGNKLRREVDEHPKWRNCFRVTTGREEGCKISTRGVAAGKRMRMGS